MATLQELQNFDIQNADVNLWLFKKSTTGTPPSLILTEHWVTIDNELSKKLKTLASAQIALITETIQYALLAQNNEGSALTIQADETDADQIVTKSADQTNNKRIEKIKTISNTHIYAIKFTSNNQNLYCVKKTDDSWKTKKKAGSINTMFTSEILKYDDTPSFNISKSIDFYILNDSIFIRNKKSFESALNYKSAHTNDFNELAQEQTFVDLFTDIAEIRKYVGTNAIQLRRASAIRQKQHYTDTSFMNNLRQEHTNFGLTINFDQNNKIVPCAATCPDIFRALLDHRLMSHFSGNVYDVQSTESVTP